MTIVQKVIMLTILSPYVGNWLVVYMFLIIYNTCLRQKISLRGTNLPYMRNGKRDYKREYEKYHSRPEQIKNRTERTTARRQANAAGITHKGDGKDIDHKVPLSKGGSNAKSNQRVVSASTNRSFARNANGSLKSQTSKRERKK